MNESSGGWRSAEGWPGSVAGPGWRSPGPQRARIPGARAVVLAAALAATALMAAACGGGSGGLVSAQQTNYQKALAFSQCMRAHGEPGFPDPQSNGSL